MIDINTHRILDMIDSREYDTVKKWLNSYQNLKVVSRDGSITYRNAITDSHPSAIQVSDRFHLLKNLTSYASDYLKKEMKQYVSIRVRESESNVEVCGEARNISKADINRKLTLNEKYERIEQFLPQGKTKTWICRELNMDVRSYDRLISMSPEERESAFNTKMMLKHEENVNKKMETVTEVRSLKKTGLSNREISRRTGITTTTIRKYLSENFTPIHASYGKKKAGKLIPYIKEIDVCLEKGMIGSVIEEELRRNGYKGSSSTLRHYIADWKRRRKQDYDRSSETVEKTESIERKDILKLLYHPIDKVKAINKDRFERICEDYLCFQRVHTLIWKFKELLRGKNVEGLEDWMQEARNSEIREVGSFVNGLERDIDAVKNAIKYEYNNGLAEGSVNKLKVIKRIMYGRCSFDTLKHKILRLEKMH